MRRIVSYAVQQRMRHANKKLFTLAVLILTFLGGVIYIQVGQTTNLLLKQQLHQFNTTTGNLFGDGKQRDWHDYEAIARDAQRKPSGLGEFGKAASLIITNNRDDNVIKSLKEFGFNVPLSERISLKRALPDFRHKSCHNRTYHVNLPKTSIIIVYHNEERFVLLRTIHSIINRTPKELLNEILLIDDFSDEHILGRDFPDYISANFTPWIKYVRSQKRLGLIKARVFGARKASGEILVFLDAHVEATHNWLPPLLEPIVENPSTCTTPIIDTIDYMNFAYIPATPSRGGFNWQFNYVQMPLLVAEIAKLPAPHVNPVMNGGLFAIKADYFWHLGAYDEQLEIWGAEQFELSFKIWLCGGRLLEVPCSRLGHLYRSPAYRVKYTNRTDDFISKNYKRIAEVWLDAYKETLYEHIPKLNSIDAGDLSAQRNLRENLRCKSFAWFLTTIAPDLLRIYPPLEPPDYAYGALQSLVAPELCLDALKQTTRQIVQALQPCSPDLRHPYASQYWHLGFRRDLRNQDGSNCLEVQTWPSNAPLWLWPCHNQGGNQYWYYDRHTQLLVHGNGANDTERRCLEANLQERKVYVNNCDFVKPTMKWRFGYINHTAMNGFFKGI